MFRFTASNLSAEIPLKVVAFEGGSCTSCMFWVEKLGCCRSDCTRFRSMIPVERCSQWKRLGESNLKNVSFTQVPWAGWEKRSA